MKQGRTIVELAAELQAQAARKKDFIAPTSTLTMMDNGMIRIGGQGEYSVTEHSHNQIGERLGIPAKYYDRMRTEAPDLLAQNVNKWFQKSPERRMLRTMVADRPDANGNLRAFLSDRYRRLDNLDMMMAVVPFMTKEYGKELKVASCEVTEQRLYLKVIAPHTERDLNTMLKPGTHVRVNEPVYSGFIVQNSEIGMGSISAFPFVEILRCTNGLTVTEYGQRKYHAGRRMSGGGDDAQDLDSILSDDTRKLDDAAFWSKTKDIIRACLDPEKSMAIFRKMAEARDMKIEAPVQDVVEVLADNYGLSESEKAGVLTTLVDSGMGLTAYGLMNAVTQVSQAEGVGYDRASELEVLGGKLINLPPSEWKALSTAKAA